MRFLYTFVRPARLLVMLVLGVLAFPTMVIAEDSPPTVENRTATGIVQNQDLRRVPQAIVELRDQEGTLVESSVTDEDGEFSVKAPTDGIFSVRAILETYRSEYIVLDLGKEKPAPMYLDPHRHAGNRFGSGGTTAADSTESLERNLFRQSKGHRSVASRE